MPIELKRGMGSSTTDRENLQHLQRKRLLSLAPRCGGCGTQRSSEFGSVLTLCAAVYASRAHQARRFPGALRRSDLLEPAWSALPAAGDVVIFVLAKLLIGRFWFGADAGVQAVDADVGFAGSGRRRWCRSS